MPDNIFSINDFETQLKLCQQMEIMVIFPSMCVPPILSAERKQDESEMVHVFPIRGFKRVQSLDFVVREGITMPAYVHKAYELIRDECTKFEKLPHADD